jgi:hypothetical protein
VTAACLLVGLAVPLAVALPVVAAGGGVGGSPGAGGQGGSDASSTGLVAGPVPQPGAAVADIPTVMLSYYLSAAKRCPGLPWTVLAGIGKVETDHGRGPEISPAGAEGPMQFLPSTWAQYGVDGDGDGVASIWDAADAVPAAADLLCANGGGTPAGLDGAIFAYNHSDPYVQLVLGWATRYATAVGAEVVP